jgi:hypothetical protein
MASSGFKLICSKEQMYLRKNADQNVFCLEFTCNNPAIDLRNLLQFDTLFRLLTDLNKDIVESIRVCHHCSENDVEVLYLFNTAGANNNDLGISKRYMYVNKRIEQRINSTTGQQEIVFTSKSVNCPTAHELQSAGYELIETPLSVQKFIANDPHTLQIIHMFRMNLQTELPVYLENSLGILIKRIYHRFKTFVEAIPPSTTTPAASF